MNIPTLTPRQLRKAADLKERIDALQNELNELLGGEAPGPAQGVVEPGQAAQRPKNGRRKKRKKVSPEGLANIRAAAKARWAARRGEALATEAEKPARQPRKTKKQVMEARLKALAKAREARWAKVRAAKRAAVQSKEGAAIEAEKPKKRNISAAGRRVLAATGKCSKTATLNMRWAKRGARNRCWNKMEEDACNEGVKEDGAGRRPTFPNRRIYPVFGSPLTEGLCL
jgi:hypothetical protein